MWIGFFRDLMKKNGDFVIQENEIIILLNLHTEPEKWGSQTTVNIYESLHPDSTLYPSNILYPGTLKTSETLYG